MKFKTKFLILFLVLTVCFVPVKNLFAGFDGETIYTFSDTDTPSISQFQSLFYFFDLRERETFIQLTAPDLFNLGNAIAHIQIFNVNSNCNENNFFDIYTPNDTLVYNMRDIQTNDSKPSGVVLPDGAYGIVAVVMYPVNDIGGAPAFPFGNMRIIDNNGYEYRTNAVAPFFSDTFGDDDDDSQFYSFNFNQVGGVSLSDVVGITLLPVESQFIFDWIAEPVQGIFSPFDIDIVDLNETIFSCRDILFSCVDEDHPLLEELLSIAGTANVASFEYGINNAIPHSKGGELLCPGNNIGEGTVLLRAERYPTSQAYIDIIESINNIEDLYSFAGFVGLNNGNGRGSFDSFWIFNLCEFFGGCET